MGFVLSEVTPDLLPSATTAHPRSADWREVFLVGLLHWQGTKGTGNHCAGGGVVVVVVVLWSRSGDLLLRKDKV